MEQTNLDNWFDKTASTIDVKNPQDEANLMIDFEYLMTMIMIKLWSGGEEEMVVTDEIENIL